MRCLWILVAVAACGPPRTPAREAGTGQGDGTGAGAGTVATATTEGHARRADCGLAAAGCHEVAECHGRGICEPAAPTSDPGCGIPPRRVEDCRTDAGCKAGEVCNAFRHGCEVGHRCEPRCDTAGCDDGWACRADGRCTAKLCPDEWSCGDYGECRPRAPGEAPLQGGRDGHACVPLACAGDADCPCAHCVHRSCTPIPGRCIEPRG